MTYKILKDKLLHIRISEFDDRKIKELAKHFECNKSAVIRMMINKCYAEEILNRGDGNYEQ